jgi:hypothetical protein
MSSEMGATAHAEGMMGSALEHEPAGWDMILDRVRLRVRTAWSERLCARGAQREAPWRKCASRHVSPIDSTGQCHRLSDSSVADGVGFADDGALVVDSFRALFIMLSWSRGPRSGSGDRMERLRIERAQRAHCGCQVDEIRGAGGAVNMASGDGLRTLRVCVSGTGETQSTHPTHVTFVILFGASHNRAYLRIRRLA